MDATNWRQFGQQWLPGALEGLKGVTSADKLYESLRGTELYVPRSYVREWWNDNVRAQNYAPLLNRLGQNDLAPRSAFKTTDTFTRDNYFYLLNVTGFNPLTGETTTQHIGIYDNQNLSIGELQFRAAQMAEGSGVSVIGPDFDVSIQSVFHRRGGSW